MSYIIRESGIELTENYLMHHGTKGQKWGLRRYQNPDGSLTEEGKRRYNKLYDAKERAQKTLAKRQKKLEKADAIKKQLKTTKYERKAARLRARSIRKMKRATSRLPEFITGDKGKNFEKAIRLERRSLRYANKANKLKSTAAKRRQYVLRTQKRLAKYDRKMSKLDPKNTARGKKFVESRL